ncbi:halocyanin domain-containing protein [Halalkalicoccus sp. NIPERK01]|uniref:halocyanin domain-containing protein n=1 Tax=Halalkalicoccus sp. NIPERK01 TaxID=3053469 RepID=UPI00256EC954|nr:halocyanin domain-containing protein [Halalkalicoccus sp. NIPERK01]MDL5362560.1 halocyanin domain-containing protein [Halalkalicoccus sp. NIPERK01]
MKPNDIDRRRFLRIAGVTATATLVAGCTAADDSDDDGNGGTDEGSTPEENGDEGAGETDFVGSEEEPDYGGFMDDVPNYERTYDFRGEETVDVAVGAGDGGLTFEPAAIMVDPGTTVIWEWTGEGGAHNVTGEDGSFASELVGEAGHTFEHAFEEAGVYEYVCTPHEANGMKGAVAVADE